jgi:AraC family transcriptional regulator
MARNYQQAYTASSQATSSIEATRSEETERSADQLLLSSDIYQWKGISVRCYDLAPRPNLLEISGQHRTDLDSIFLLLQGSHVLKIVYNGRTWQDRMLPGNICIFPRESQIAGCWAERIQVLHICLGSMLVANLARDVNRSNLYPVMLRWRFNIRDLLIQQIGLALKIDLEQRCPLGPLYAESLGQSLVLHLLRNYSSLTLICDLVPQGHTPLEIQRVLTHIDDMLDQQLSLADLADVAGLSPTYLIRQFKKTTGLTPHQYLIERRVERARELLMEGHRTIAEVASAVGFTDQSHLDRHFKRLLGVTPRDVILG